MLIVLVATAQKAWGPISASGSSWTWHEGNIGCLNIALSYMVLASQPLLQFFHFHSQQQQEVWKYFNVSPHIHDDGPGDPKVSGSISKSWLPSVCVTVHRREWICMVTYACIHCWCFFQCKLFFFLKKAAAHRESQWKRNGKKTETLECQTSSFPLLPHFPREKRATAPDCSSYSCPFSPD